MTEPVAPPPKDLNDLAQAGKLPADLFEAGTPTTVEELRREAEGATVAALPEPPAGRFDDEDPNLARKSNGKGGGRKIDGRISFMRPKFDRGDHAEMADKLSVVLAPDKSLLVHDEGLQYFYDQKTGVWESVPDETLRAIVKGFGGCEKRSKDGTVALHVNHNAAQGAVRFLADETYEKDFFDDAEKGASFKNGFFVCRNGVLEKEPNAPSNRARFAFPFDYDPEAKHPMLDSFFEEVFANCTEEERADRIALLQEAAGAALFGMATTYQKAVLMFGRGGSGKSQFAEIMFAVLPKAMCSALPPHKWGERFAVSSLVGIALNIVAELPEKELLTTEVFKAVITGDYIDAEKKFLPSFRFKSRALHIFMANTLPITKDFTDAFFRRFVICPYERDMIAAACHVEDIGKKIAATERQAIVSWTVEGALRLQRQKGYTTPKVGTEVLSGWRTSSDNVALFVEDACDVVESDDARDGTKGSVLYGRYKEWTKINGYEALGNKNFSSRMEMLKLKVRKANDGNYYPVSLKRRGDGEL